jgi:hypothetical protein
LNDLGNKHTGHGDSGGGVGGIYGADAYTAAQIDPKGRKFNCHFGATITDYHKQC